jgi:hypothetical protein
VVIPPRASYTRWWSFPTARSWRRWARPTCAAHRLRAGLPRAAALRAKPLDFARLSLTFEAPDEARFPCLRLARAALREGGSAPVVLNGANEARWAPSLKARFPSATSRVWWKTRFKRCPAG